MDGEPFDSSRAKKLLLKCITNGVVIEPEHAKKEMGNDNLTSVDCVNVLRGGVIEPAEWENDAWRYRVRTNTMYVVVEFESETEVVIVTAWRIKR